MIKDEGTMADRVKREDHSETRVMRRSWPCKSLEEEHSRQREQEVVMSLASLSHMADGRLVVSEVAGSS